MRKFIIPNILLREAYADIDFCLYIHNSVITGEAEV